MGVENRKSIRRNVNQPGIILGAKGAAQTSCTMSDVSATGARLEIDAQADLPEEFILLLSRSGQTRRRCRIMWRLPDAVGVKFLIEKDRLR